MELRQLIQAPTLSIPERYRVQVPLVAGLGCWFVGLGTYKLAGFNGLVAAMIAGSIVSVGWGILRLEDRALSRPKIDTADLLIALLLVGIFVPLYLVELYRLPFPVHNDEVRLMILEAKLSQPGIDWFGVSEYLSMPILLFSSFGWLGRALGGIELTTMRAVHGMSGVLIILASYAMFRTSASRLTAFGAAAIVGINHSLWMLSRMALWDNSSLLFEVIALTLLMQGLKRRSPAIAFWGGVAVGLCFYVYLPARATIPIWILFLIALFVYFHGPITRRELLAQSVASFVGCLLVVMPLLLTNTNKTDQYTTEYRFLLTPTGLEHQRLHALGASGQPEMSVLGGYLFNVQHGLTAFNNTQWDNGGMYSNPNHGFVDPLTGILLWVGLAAVALAWRRGTLPRRGDLLAVVGFLSLWLTLTFLVNQAPNYTRMLVSLPFAAYLAAKGVEWLAESPRRLVGERIELLSIPLKTTSFVIGVMLIGLWNLGISGDYIAFAQEDGSIRGATARYVMARADQPEYSYHLFADDDRPYYVWGSPDLWSDWIRFFASAEQQLSVKPPEDCPRLEMSPPFTAFMNATVWQDCGQEFSAEYPHPEFRYMNPTETRVAIEVLDD